MGAPTTGLHRLLRVLARRRRLIAILLVCCAIGLTVEQFTPALAVSSPAVVAAADLPSGHVLTAGDLTVADFDPTLLPSGSVVDPGAMTGQQLAAPLRRGTPLTDASILGPGLLTGAPAGQVAVPLQIAEPAVLKVVRPSDRVDVVVSSDTQPAPEEAPQAPRTRTVAKGVTVLWTSSTGEGSGAWPGGGGSDEPLVVVAASREAAEALAGSSVDGRVSLVLVGGGR